MLWIIARWWLMNLVTTESLSHQRCTVAGCSTVIWESNCWTHASVVSDCYYLFSEILPHFKYNGLNNYISETLVSQIQSQFHKWWNTVSFLYNVIATRCHGNTVYSFLCSQSFGLNQLSAFTKMYQLSSGSFRQTVYSGRLIHSSILNENGVRNEDQGQKLLHAIFFT